MARSRKKINANGCTARGCDLAAYCRGFCKNHYRRVHYEEHERARRGAKKTFKDLAQENNRTKAAEVRERLLEKQRKADYEAEEAVMNMIYGPPKKEDDEAAE